MDIEELKKKHGKIRVFKYAGEDFAVRKLKRIEWRKFQADTVEGVSKHEGSVVVDAQEDLAKRACVSHTPEQLDAFADDVAADVFSALMDAIKIQESGAEEARARG